MADTLFETLVTKMTTAWAQGVNDFLYKGRNPIFATTTGSANAYVLTLPSGSLYSALVTGDFFDCKANFTNTGAATLTIVGASSIGPTSITTLAGSALVAGQILSGQVIRLVYNGTSFSLQSAVSDISAEVTAGVNTVIATAITQTLWIPGSTMYPSISPLGAPNNYSIARNLAGGTETAIPQFVNLGLAIGDSAQFTIAFPAGWDLGTVTFQPFWTIITGAAITGTKAKFALSGVALGDATLADVSFGTAIGVEQTVASPIAYTQYVGAESAAVTIANTPAANELCYFRIERIAAASDDFPGDLTLLGIKLRFSATIGS